LTAIAKSLASWKLTKLSWPTFDCRAKGGDSEIEPISMWMRMETRDRLNMWIFELSSPATK
jgi:hypothetical protein